MTLTPIEQYAIVLGSLGILAAGAVWLILRLIGSLDPEPQHSARRKPARPPNVSRPVAGPPGPGHPDVSRPGHGAAGEPPTGLTEPRETARPGHPDQEAAHAGHRTGDLRDVRGADRDDPEVSQDLGPREPRQDDPVLPDLEGRAETRDGETGDDWPEAAVEWAQSLSVDRCADTVPDIPAVRWPQPAGPDTLLDVPASWGAAALVTSDVLHAAVQCGLTRTGVIGHMPTGADIDALLERAGQLLAVGA